MTDVSRSLLIRATSALVVAAGLTVTSADEAAAADLVTERVSVTSGGAQANGVSTMTAISADGQYVAFASTAADLVPGDTNGRQDVFLHDSATNATTRVSVTSTGAQTSVGGPGTLVGAVSISGDGRFVAFLSNASDVVAGDTNGTYDAFVHDRISGVTSRVSVTSDGTQAQSTPDDVGISSDGRYVLFRSQSPALNQGSGNTDVFVHDRVTGLTTSATSAGGGSGVQAALSPDGRYVAFIESTPAQVYLRDLQQAQTIQASVSTDGVPGNLASSQPVVSRGGRFVAFTSSASNLVPGDTNGVRDTFVHDVLTGETTRVNVTSAGSQAMGGLSFEGLPSISDDGRYVAFAAVANNLVPNDTNGAPDIFVHDRVSHETNRVSVSGSGIQANNFSAQPALSGDSSFVGFHSRASNLVAGDTNAQEDVFARQLLIAGDSTPPEISYTLTPAEPDGDDGWFRSDVQLDWTVVDEQSAVEVTGCADQTIVVDQRKTEYACSAASSGGATGPVSVTIGRDATHPTLQAAASPSTPDGDNGWYVSPVLLTYSCTDATSGIAGCPTDHTVGEGASQAVPGTALDRAGNAHGVLSGPFSVDLTDPVVTCAEEPVYLLNQSGTVSWTVTDEMSGPSALLVVADVDTTTAGHSSVAVTGQDIAGHATEAMCGYRVEYGFSGFTAPVDNDAVNVSKAGTAVPLKWQLVDHAGQPVTDLSSVSVTSSRHACDGGAPEDLVEEVATGASGLQNLGEGHYQLNWKSAKSYAGTCRTLQLDLGEVRLRTAEFRFKA